MIKKNLFRIMNLNYTENDSKYSKLNFGLVGAMFLISAIMLLFLPDQTSILHTGDIYYPLSSIIGIWLITIFFLFLNFVFIMRKRATAFNSIVMAILLIASTAYYVTLM